MGELGEAAVDGTVGDEATAVEATVGEVGTGETAVGEGTAGTTTAGKAITGDMIGETIAGDESAEMTGLCGWACGDCDGEVTLAASKRKGSGKKRAPGDITKTGTGGD